MTIARKMKNVNPKIAIRSDQYALMVTHWREDRVNLMTNVTKDGINVEMAAA